MRSIKPWYVAVYFQELCFGGHEEGGWYYNSGVLQGKVKAFPDHESALAFRERAQRSLDAWHEENERDLSSVLSRGRYGAELYDEYPPHHYPDNRPRYE